MTLDEKLKLLPTDSGVYLHKNADGKIIYIGKAKNLKNRVRQYFHSSRNHDRKTRELVKRITDFEFIVVDNEVEALVLESNLIKKHKPRYNILLKDDKQYPHFKITKRTFSKSRHHAENTKRRRSVFRSVSACQTRPSNSGSDQSHVSASHLRHRD